MENVNKRGVGRFILVTGGGGYVGSHVALKLLEEGYEVVVVDNASNCCMGKVKTPESLTRIQILSGRKLNFHLVNIQDGDGLREVFKKYKFDSVIHFAALKSVSESCSKPLDYYSNNVNGSIVLIKVCLEFGVNRFIYSSSSTVYGTPIELPIKESHPTGIGCTNPYGKTKHMVEEILNDLCTSDESFRVVSLRYFNPVGAHTSGRIGEDPSGIPNNLMPYVSQVAIGKLSCLKVFGNDYDTIDGTGVRDYIHVEDLSLGHLSALNYVSNEKNFIEGGNCFKAFNLGTGRGYSVLEVINAFSKASGRPIKYEIVGRREGDVASSYCDIRLAKKELGWSAKKGLDEMCRDMWKWQTMNPEGYVKSNDGKL